MGEIEMKWNAVCEACSKCKKRDGGCSRSSAMCFAIIRPPWFAVVLAFADRLTIAPNEITSLMPEEDSREIHNQLVFAKRWAPLD